MKQQIWVPLFLCISFLPVHAAFADDGDTPPASDPPATSSADVVNDTCSPPCRPGYFCDNGQCKSPCNPECPSKEVCTRNGVCLPGKPPAVNGGAMGSTSSSGAGPVSRALSPTATAGSSTVPMGKAPPSGLGQRITGGIFMGIGLVNFLTAPICMSDMVQEEIQEDCLKASLAVGGIFLVIGIPLVASGSAKKRRLLEWRANQNAHLQSHLGLNIARDYGGLFWTAQF